MRHKSETFEIFKEYKAEVGTVMVRVSSLYDLIMEANTSWVSLGSTLKIMGSHPRCMHPASHSRTGWQRGGIRPS